MNKKTGVIIAAGIAAALTAVVLILIFAPKGGSDKSDATTKSAAIDDGVEMTVSTDSKGVHQAEVATDSEGKIDNNSYGTLINYVPADITNIHIENKKGTLDVVSKTPEGEATIYTIKGYEDFDLQAGNPDLIASAASKLDFSEVASLDKAKSGDFGFDDPRSTVTVTYTDGTKSVIIVGNDAPQAAGTYVKFGSGDTVYVIDTETASAFDFGVTDLISLTINDSADDTDNNQASEINISGSGFDKEITLVPNENENYSASYLLTQPVKRVANESESSKITGGIRGLYADSVDMVNPSDSQLSEMGLSTPYAHIKAVYPDTTVDLISSQPDSDGKIHLMVSGRNVVYTLSASKAAWCQTSYEKLCYEYVLFPKMTQLTSVTVTTDGKTYEFTLDTRESVSTDNEGSETTSTVTVVKYNGEEIQLGNFTAFYDLISLIGLADAKTDGGSGSETLSIKYTYSDTSSDTVSFIDAGGDLYVAELNGEIAGHSYKADVTRAKNGIAAAIE